MGESVAIGIVGGVLGVGLGFAGAALVSKYSGSLSASLASNVTGSATPGGSRFFGGGAGGAGGTGGTGGGFGGGGGGGTTGTGNPFRGAFSSARAAADTVAVHLTAPVTITVIVAAVGLAVLGGLIAGAFGGWRAARLRPAAALSKVG
jgi:putative ABC transport system permease protein